MSKRYVLAFDEADPADSSLLGGKGAGLARMIEMGLAVPPGFTITTAACRYFLEHGRVPPKLWTQVEAALSRVEEQTGRQLGAEGGPPLLLSARSGAKISMPGMMDTVLNLGANHAVVSELTRWSGDARFAWDAFRRLFQTYGGVVLGAGRDDFEEVMTSLRQRRNVTEDSRLPTSDLVEAVRRFRMLLAAQDSEVPVDPMEQVRSSIRAVFESWNSPRAHSYRRLNGIPHDLGTACNIQMMVFGNLGADSGTGVFFTRDPATGEKEMFGDYLTNAQGEDVVAGIRQTSPISHLAETHPEAHEELHGVGELLESTYSDMCDIEFTIERSKLWILQTRVGKRSAAAAVRAAVEMVEEGLIDRETALMRVEPTQLEQLLVPGINEEASPPPAFFGLEASPGAAVGRAVFDVPRAVEMASQGIPVILVRWETTPDDIDGMFASEGILTSHGGKTSHAAVVARAMGTPAVTGAAEILINSEKGFFTTPGGLMVREGDNIAIDGTTGRVFIGEVELVAPSPPPELTTLLEWADQVRRLGIWANADTGKDAARAAELGAEGIGLARTEHMFMGDRLPVVRRIIMDEGRRRALAHLEQLQADDFTALLEAMDGKPVVVRLLDPPLHEFLPDRWDLRDQYDELKEQGEPTAEVERMIEVVRSWEETNPMLGLRGVRLGLIRPSLYRVQIRAALQAIRRRLEAGGRPMLEIMVPLVVDPAEMERVAVMLAEEQAAFGMDQKVKLGNMVEIPRAALLAGELARISEFFSFGTNDLTQTTFGLSRDDAEIRFLNTYLADGVLSHNPFQSLDERGVGLLVKWATEQGKAARPDLSVGLCGEHGGDPDSIDFCHRVGLDYVSMSPPRIPGARLAAAQAAIRNGHGSASGS
ncbi:MAG: pyruvate, phosphate dikinase [bacterium]|nr:pyruvate, phosphate dikinase [Acidimicrobiia bacterium]MCY4650740.1 pyruvate, phosphate dikinase [bacterium]